MLNHPDFNRLKVFYYVYTGQSVANAAHQLNITQSAVSQQVKKLEEEIKSSLFVRQHKRLIPTSEAHSLFAVIDPFMHDLDSRLRSIRQAKEQPAGELRIGSPHEFGQTWMPGLLAAFHRHYPEVSFKLRLGDAQQMLALLDQGQLDIALIDEYLLQRIAEQDLKHYDFKKLIDEEVILAGSRSYCEEHLGMDFSLHNLTKQNYISCHHDALALTNWFRHHHNKPGLKLSIVLEAENLQAAMCAMENHLGLCVTASHLIFEQIKQGNVVQIKGAKTPIINRISMAQLQDKIPSLTEKFFLAHIQQEVQKTGALK